MTRARPVETALAGLATLVACAPILTLFEPDLWVPPAITCVLVAGVVGMIGRHLQTSGRTILLAQVLTLTATICVVHGQGHLWGGIVPTPETFQAFNILLTEARGTITEYAAPAPAGRGISLGLGIIIGAVAVAVDQIGVTHRSPALAGLPLLAAYLITASNSGTGLSWIAFVPAAVAWLLLIGHEGTLGMRRWSSVAALPDDHGHGASGDPTRGFVSTARLLGAGAIVCALVLPVFTPHLPTRFLIDGLGRTTSGGGGGGSVSLSTTLDLSRSLNNRSTEPVLTYRTSDTSPPPLRVEVLTRFVDGVAQPSNRARFRPSSDEGLPPPAGLRPDLITEETTYRIEVVENRLQAPQLALPYPAIGGELNAQWTVDSVGVVTVESAPDSYTVTYVGPEPSTALLQASDPPSASPHFSPADLALEPQSAALVRETAAEVVPEDASDIEAAVAIQDYLRGPDFTYSLQLAGPVVTDDGEVEDLDPISHFLVTKQGYCQQFATAMIMMARAEGIPARMALGFLPGQRTEGMRLVRANDAHAWPELYFEDVGWLRFEPTPGQRSGLAPDYTELSDETGSGGDTSETPTPGQTTPAPLDPAQIPQSGAETATGQPAALSWEGAQTWPKAVWVVLTLVLLVGLALLVPLAAWWRRRQVEHSVDDVARVEWQWQDMLRRIDDLGLTPPISSTPRQSGEYLRHRGYLEGDEVGALRRVVATLEHARYASPGTPIEDMTDDTGSIVRAVGASRRRSDRLRAWWVPQDGVDAWRGLGLRAVAAPGRLLRRGWGRMRR